MSQVDWLDHQITMTVGQLKRALSNLPDDMKVADRYDSFYYHEMKHIYRARMLTADSSDFKDGQEVCIIATDAPPDDEDLYGARVTQRL